MFNSLPAIWTVRSILISNRPSINSPLTSTDLEYNFVLEASSFSELSSVDTFDYAEWELSTLSDFSIIDKTFLNSTDNKTQWTLSGLNKNTIYYARVRYKGLVMPLTGWSASYIFNTKNVIDISTTWIYDNFDGTAGPLESHLTAEGYSWGSFEAYNDTGRTNNVAFDLDGQGNVMSNNALNKSIYNAVDNEGVITYAEFGLSDAVVLTPLPESNYYSEIAFHVPATNTAETVRRTRIGLMSRIKSPTEPDQGYVDFVLVFSNTKLVLWAGGGGVSNAVLDPLYGLVVSPIEITQIPYDCSVAKDYVLRVEVEGPETRCYLNNILIATRYVFDGFGTEFFNELLNRKYVGFNIASNNDWMLNKTEPLATTFHSDPSVVVPSDDPYIGSFDPSALNLKISYFKAGSLTSSQNKHWVYDNFNGTAGPLEGHLTPEGYKWAPFQYGDSNRVFSQCLFDLDGQGNVRSIVDITNSNSSWCDGIPVVTFPSPDYYAEVGFSAPATADLATWRESRITLMLRVKDLPDPLWPSANGTFVDYDFVFANNLSEGTELSLWIGTMGGHVNGPNVVLSHVTDSNLLQEFVFRVEVEGAEARAYVNGVLVSTDVIDFVNWGNSILDHRHAGFGIISYTQNEIGRNWEPFVHYFKAGPLTDVPKITSPTLLTKLDYNFSLTSSPFINFSNLGTHVSSDWELSLNSNFVSLETSVYNTSTNKRTWNVSNLTPSSNYFIRVRYNNSELTSGSWSIPYSFRTKSLPMAPWIYDNFDGTAGSITAHLTPEGYSWAPFDFYERDPLTSQSLLELDGQGNAVRTSVPEYNWTDGVPLVALPSGDYYTEVVIHSPAVLDITETRSARIKIMSRIGTMELPINGVTRNSYVDYDFIFSNNLSESNSLRLYCGGRGGQNYVDSYIYIPGIYDNDQPTDYVFRVEVEGAVTRAYVNGVLIITNTINTQTLGTGVLDSRYTGFGIMVSFPIDGSSRTWYPIVQSFKAGPLQN